MTISPELEQEILRLFHAEKWLPGTIAYQLSVHYSAVKRVLEQEGTPPAKIIRPSKMDPYLPFIRATLEKYPTLTAARLYEMVKERGYPGKPSHFRDIVSRIRPSRPAEAYLRLRSTPGDEGQVDWGHFGRIEIGRAKRPLVAFVIVLSYSRAVFLRFFLGQQMSFFLKGHEEAFERWRGVPRNLLYDNLKSVVTTRERKLVQFNDDFLAFAAHHRFRPQPVGIRRGNEKGRVERTIRFIRTSFFAARRFDNLEDLNEQASCWSLTTAMERRWPDDDQLSVADAFIKEQPLLLPLRDTGYPCHDRKEVKAGKTPYIRFDLNDYSVPHHYARKLLVVLASPDTLRITHGHEVIAEHPRSFDRHAVIEDPSHIAELKSAKQRAGKGSRTNDLFHAAPSSEELLKRALEQGTRLGDSVRQLRQLLFAYSAEALERAIQEALAKGAGHPQAVRHILERDRLEAGHEAALPLSLPNNPKIRDLTVKPHSLTDYDHLTESEDDNDSSGHRCT